jgi:hypothetical protein
LPTTILYAFLISPACAACPAHRILNLIIRLIHETPRYAHLPTQKLSSASRSQIPSPYVLSLGQDIKFHTNTKLQVNLQFGIV